MKLSDVMSAATGLSAYAEIALVIFLGVFLGVIIDLFFSGRRNEAMQLLPLEDDFRSRPVRRAERAQP
jgi:hypothetical protein